jgi:2-polyprenyl-6-methoxyphenol hydroxylase-like FAD-dependent oxidoreductase
MVGERTEVTVVGAGPTGLVLALWLARRGVAVRIIDAADRPGTTSRALVVHARTLELYRQLGIATDIVAHSLTFTTVNLWARGRHAGRIVFDDIGRGMTPYPYIVILPQDEHERLLAAALARTGVEVERSTELVDFAPVGDAVSLRMRHPGGAESTLRAAYVVGCDGAHSRVRELIRVGFPGGTYDRMFYVADVAMRGPTANHELHVALDDADFLAVFPLAGDGAARIIGTMRSDAATDRAPVWDDIRSHAVERMQLDVERVNWLSTYRVHHRVARHFRRGRIFLAGDAAHIHSPVGGQGMNTGIGDAVNLAWKLASVVAGEATPALLDSYEPERIAFARRLVASTDRAFSFVTRDGAIARRVRMGLVPRLLPRLGRRRWFRRVMFRALSQTDLNYHRSRLSAGRAGRVRAGDRLPWVRSGSGDGPDGDNFAPLRSMDWQLHVYGVASPALQRTAAARDLALHVFPFDAPAAAAGLARNAVYLVRPDGYVALADRGGRVWPIIRYFSRRPARLPLPAGAAGIPEEHALR